MRNILIVLSAAVTAVAAVAGLGVLACCWLQLPSLSIEHDGSRVVAHTEFLGDYPSDIGLIEVMEANSAKTLWRGVPENGTVQVHSLAFTVGENSTAPSVFSGKFQLPGGSPPGTFRLVAATPYVVKVCAPTLIPICKSEGFMFVR